MSEIAKEYAETNPIPIIFTENAMEIVETSEIVPDESVAHSTDAPANATDDENDEEMTEDEHSSPNSRPNRELKQLLALSKEANLDTNISHKRKSMDVTKTPTDQLKKSKVEKSVDFFPVTAESELEAHKEIIQGSTIEESLNEDAGNASKPAGSMESKDIFCWRCHRDSVNISCETCPRSYHFKCLKQSSVPDVNNWPCPECVLILKAESTQTRTSAMKGMTLEHLCSLLKFAVKRMIECNGSEPFLHQVDEQHFPDYKKYIVQPMSLTLLGQNINKNLYGSPQAFEADAKWILHNSIIFNSYQSKVTTAAKTIMKICKQEMAEIEKCPNCYLNANTKKSTWFVEVCPKPHILVWAKLKGFPFWPAKVMCTNSSGMVDVRFFGAHDRAWIPSKECFLYSRKDPNSNKQKRNDIVECMKEVDVYISNIKAVYGEFNYAPFKHQYDPDNELQQLLLFIPRYLTLTNRRSRLSSTKGRTPKKDGADETMDGYGTDEETIEAETLDTKKRALMLVGNLDSTPTKQANHSENESNSDEEESESDDDTQVSANNSTTDNIIRVKIKSKTPKSRSDLRRPSDEIKEEAQTPKSSRRNSDQSVKSDSSRLSTVSEKINIPENVELAKKESVDGIKNKEPVQVEIENNELTISPSKSRMSEKLIKKLSPVQEKLTENVKSETDIILEKYKNLVKEKMKASTSISKSNVENKTIIMTSNDVEVKEGDNEENVISSTENNATIDTPTETPETLSKENINDEKKILANANSDKVTPKKKGEVTFRLILPKADSSSSSSFVRKKEEHIIPNTSKESEVILKKEEVKEKLPKAVSGSPYVRRRDDPIPNTSNEPEDVLKKEEVNEKLPSEPTRKTYKGASPATHKIKVVKTNITSIEEASSAADSKTSIENGEKKLETVNESSDKIKESSDKIISQSEVADSNSSEDQEVDESMVQSISSSLKEEMERSKKRVNDGEEKGEKSAKKPKLGNSLLKENFKIVPIQTILNKKIDNTTPVPNQNRSTPTKSVSADKGKNKQIRNAVPMDLVTVEIKSEPESDPDHEHPENEETEYMEKKRKYLSALNISEKTSEDAAAARPKKNEIRTRSKTEEIGKNKSSDTISKVIEEVATSFSSKHESKKRDNKKSNQNHQQHGNSSNDSGEIFVKSFAKVPIQPKGQLRIDPKPRNFNGKSQKSTGNLVPTTTLTRITPISTAITTTVSQSQTGTSMGKSIDQLQQAQAISTNQGNVLILTQPGMILPTSQQLTYNAGSFVTFVPSQQNVAMMPTTQMMNAVMAPMIQQNNTPVAVPQNNTELITGFRQQNVPQNTNRKRKQGNNDNTDQPQTTSEVPTLTPSNENHVNSQSGQGESNENRTDGNGADDEFGLLNSLVPESVSRAISDVLCRPPPKLKPRPPGPLSQNFDSGTPSAAGPVSARINSISHKLGDYFRGMLIEMLGDLGKSSNPEATISALKQEMESLKHKHNLEMMDIRKNVCTILKDIQGSISEERERIVEETRTACEVEALRRIEEAKSKQWCANCGKEAQFYCCWNTSYCDYPCQQKHWSKHMGKCTQNSGQNQQVQTPPARPQGQITFRPATPKTFTGRILTKPTKVYLKGGIGQKNGSSFKGAQGHLALVETSNLEFLANTTVGTKIVAPTSLLTRVKTVNSASTSPSNGTQKQQKSGQNNVNNMAQAAKPRNSDSPNIISDEESE